MLKEGARDYLVPLSRRLSAVLAETPFDPGNPERHASYALQQVGGWQAARNSIEAEPDWQRQPALLARHIQVTHQLQDEVASRTSCFRLCWLFPDECEEVLASAPSHWMRCEWERFQRFDIELPVEEFPAWLVISHPSFSSSMPAKIPGLPENSYPGYYLLHQLQRHRRDTPGLSDREITLRKALREYNEALFSCFMDSVS